MGLFETLSPVGLGLKSQAETEVRCKRTRPGVRWLVVPRGRGIRRRRRAPSNYACCPSLRPILASQHIGWPCTSGRWSRLPTRKRCTSRSRGHAKVAELGGSTLRAVADHVMEALRANGYKPTELGAGRREPFALAEETGVRLGLLFLAIRPITKVERIEIIAQGIRSMTSEEVYYWYSKCTSGWRPSVHRGRCGCSSPTTRNWRCNPMSALISSLSELIALLIQSFNLGALLPSFVFILLNYVFVRPYLKELAFYRIIGNSDPAMPVLLLAALTITLGYLLTAANTQLIRWFEGYPLWDQFPFDNWRRGHEARIRDLPGKIWQLEATMDDLNRQAKRLPIEQRAPISPAARSIGSRETESSG